MKDFRAYVVPVLGILILSQYWSNGKINFCLASPEQSLKQKTADLTPSTNQLLDQIENEVINQKLSKTSLSEAIALVKTNPHNYRAHIVLGNCCDSLGLPEEAMKQYKLAFDNGPNQPQAFIELIKALLRSGQSMAASNLLKQATRRFPTDPQILLWTGNVLYDEQKYKEAESLYTEALYGAQKPILGLSTALARLRLKEKRYSTALNLCKSDLALNPNFAQANEIAGISLMEMGKFAKAMPYLKIAFMHSPYDYLIAFDFTQSLIWCGKYNQALIPALCSLATAGTDENRQSVRKIIGQILPHLSQNTVKDVGLALKNYPPLENNSDIHIEMAQIDQTKHLTSLATTEYLTAVKLAPQSWSAKYQAAMMLTDYKHDYPLALQLLREAHAMSPDNNDITVHLMRLEDRLTNRKADWAWQIKDRLTTDS